MYEVSLLNNLQFKSGATTGTGDMIQWDDNHVLLLYSNSVGGSNGIIKIFEVAFDYQITEISSALAVEGFFDNPKLYKIDSSHVLIGYNDEGDNDGGALKVFSISSDYDITEVHYSKPGSNYGAYPVFEKIDDTHVAYIYTTFGRGSAIRIITVNTDYTLSFGTSFTISGSSSFYGGDLVNMGDGIFAFIYAGSGNDGYIDILFLLPTNSFAKLSSLEFDTTNALNISAIKIDDSHILIAYAGSGNDGYLTTFVINPDYTVNVVNSIEHDVDNGTLNCIENIIDNLYILSYVSSNSINCKLFKVGPDYSVEVLSNTSIHNSATSIGYLSFIMLNSIYPIVSHSIVSGAIIKSYYATIPHVTFNSNDGFNRINYQYGNTPKALFYNTFIRVGFKFSGWNTNIDGSGMSYADGAIYDFSEDITLYAQWTDRIIGIGFMNSGRNLNPGATKHVGVGHIGEE